LQGADKQLEALRRERIFMASLKEQLSEVVSSLPDDCTMEDFRYRLYVRRKAEEGIRAIEQGETYSHEEAVEIVKSRRKSYGQSPP
jgi:hypothetical protein